MNHTKHCEARIKYGDGECECYAKLRASASNELCEMLVSEAKKCKTDSGAILLLSLKSFLNGESQYHPPLELWQVADKLGNNE